MMKQTITLNLPYDLPESDWEKVSDVYTQMAGWVENSEYPSWYGTDQDEEYLCASVEPSGLVITGKVDEMIWIGWITVLCAKLTLALGMEIHDAEM
jgi:hypothetical protein